MLYYGLLLLLGTQAVDAATTVNEAAEHQCGHITRSKADCVSPFVEVGGRCVHFNLAFNSTWQEAQQFCQELGSDLAILTDPQFYFDLLQYIKTLGALADFWVGASDLAEEGTWLWLDGTPVTMGAPYWANHGCYDEIEPNGGTDENCGSMEDDVHYYMNDVPCSWYHLSPICVM